MSLNKLTSWRSLPILKGDGVIVGCDSDQEWLLPWWWDNYISCNPWPVSFIDFGLSKKARAWCEERGDVVDLEVPDVLIAGKGDIDPKLASDWEEIYGKTYWQCRKGWFKKPVAMLQSPYERSLWIDLDCEILGPIEILFCKCEVESGIALVRERLLPEQYGRLIPGEVIYNSGVVVFKRGSIWIQKWVEDCLYRNHEFWGDQEVLSRLIFNHNLKITEIPEIYNWRISQGLNLNAVIIHWLGSAGKNYIKKHGGLTKELRHFFHLCLSHSQS